MAQRRSIITVNSILSNPQTSILSQNKQRSVFGNQTRRNFGHELEYELSEEEEDPSKTALARKIAEMEEKIRAI